MRRRNCISKCGFCQFLLLPMLAANVCGFSRKECECGIRLLFPFFKNIPSEWKQSHDNKYDIWFTYKKNEIYSLHGLVITMPCQYGSSKRSYKKQRQPKITLNKQLALQLFLSFFHSIFGFKRYYLVSNDGTIQTNEKDTKSLIETKQFILQSFKRRFIYFQRDMINRNHLPEKNSFDFFFGKNQFKMCCTVDLLCCFCCFTTVRQLVILFNTTNGNCCSPIFIYVYLN